MSRRQRQAQARRSNSISVGARRMKPGWTIHRFYSTSGLTSREIFVDPQGTEWVRAGSVETTDIELPMRTRGVPALRLKRRHRVNV